MMRVEKEAHRTCGTFSRTKGREGDSSEHCWIWVTLAK
jgi:hypothetical protein